MCGSDHKDFTPADTEQWFGNVKALLDAGRTVEFTPQGYSMWPSLRPGRDRVRMQSARHYRPSDIVLARCPAPAGVFLHRVRRVTSDGLLLMGDSNLYQTELCAHADVAGKVVAITRDGRDVTASATTRLMAALHRLPLPMRRTIVRILNYGKRRF